LGPLRSNVAIGTLPVRRQLLLLLPALLLVACSRADLVAPQAQLGAAEAELAAAQNDVERFHALGHAAKLNVDFGSSAAARRYADELLLLAPRFRTNWNYGNAIHDGNLVLGRLAVKAENRASAKQHLLLAGGTPGSPQLNTFGPNMSLAKDLLVLGETDTVVQYFTLCKRFWKMHDGQLDRWAEDIRSGRQPDFGANLVF
jgi:hypothetical protein